MTMPKRKITVAVAVFSVMLISSLTPVAADRESTNLRTGEQIEWQVISVGGGSAISKNCALKATLGELAIGSAISKNYCVDHGFWPNIDAGNCCTTPTTGDVDGSGVTDISDLQMMVDYLFSGIPFPGTCFEEQDVDASGSIDISDLQLLVDYLFYGGRLPRCA